MPPHPSALNYSQAVNMQQQQMLSSAQQPTKAQGAKGQKGKRQTKKAEALLANQNPQAPPAPAQYAAYQQPVMAPHPHHLPAPVWNGNYAAAQHYYYHQQQQQQLQAMGQGAPYGMGMPSQYGMFHPGGCQLGPSIGESMLLFLPSTLGVILNPTLLGVK